MATFERHEIQGSKVVNGEEHWCPLYQYRNEDDAKAVVRRILRMSESDPLYADVSGYDDFRIESEEVDDWRAPSSRKRSTKIVDHPKKSKTPQPDEDDRAQQRREEVRRRRARQIQARERNR